MLSRPSSFFEHEYLQRTSKRFNYDDKGKPVGLKDYTGMQASLICVCLYDSKGKLVDEEVIMAWPASTQKGLFDAAQELNGLDLNSLQAEKAAGND